ncbi:MAG: GAF domain-containing protein [Bacteroidota bacterium]|jgi:L-methionine (R)-S-oxide reductase
MAEELKIQGITKSEKYQSLIPQIKSLVEGENNLIANLGNIASAIKYGMDFFWVGFYIVNGEELVLGPFQGTVACTRIKFGRGVCGAAWNRNETLIVDDVDQFPGHIACSSFSKSEIVVPGKDEKGAVLFVLDVDATEYSRFDTTDKIYLEEICKIATELFNQSIR